MKISHIRWIHSGSSEVDKVLAYAGRELASYVRKLSGAHWDVRGVNKVEGSADTAWLGISDRISVPGKMMAPAPWDDGFAIWSKRDGLFIAGRNARSVLFGVYAFLERQGVRFLRPGRDGELIPRVKTIMLPAVPIIEEAHYRHRGVCIEGAPSLNHALGMVDWCAKKRMNTLFLQFFSSHYFYNQWYERSYNPQYADHILTSQEARAFDEQVIAGVKKRGMVLHQVGHGWTSATIGLPRSGWVKANEEVKLDYSLWLAEVSGKRQLFKDIPINTELCYSYQPAFNAFIETVVHYCEAHPEIDVVHVWLSDAVDNKCECPECRKLSTSDWYAKVINALSEALHHRVPKIRFVFLCYIELLWPPERVAIDERRGNAILMFAPIERCYGHSLADSACDDGREWPRPPLNQFAVSGKNAFYVKALADWRQVFRGDSFDFDYHLMWAIWQQLTDTHLAHVVHDDLQHLKLLGLDGIVSCQSFRVFYPSGLAMTTLAESLWNPDMRFKEIRKQFLESAFGEQAGFADGYLAKVEFFLYSGDPHWCAIPLSNADQRKLTTFASFLETSLSELHRRRRSGLDKVRSRSLDLLFHHARFLQFIVRAHQALLTGGSEKANQELNRAAEFLRNTEPRYNTFIDTMLALRLSVEAHRPK